jgi:glyoxalase/bleomycin resistance protein/dioxygenase superfamily protein
MSRKFGPIFHMGYVVPDLDKAMQYWLDVMGVGPFFVETHDLPTGFVFKGKPIHIRSKVALTFSGENYIELIEDFSPDETPNSLFLRDLPGGTIHVAGGLQHLGCMVDDVYAAIGQVGAPEQVLMTAVVGPIRLAYVQPSREAQAGTMLELIERGPFIERKIATIKAASIGWDGSNPVRTLKLAAS